MSKNRRAGLHPLKIAVFRVRLERRKRHEASRTCRPRDFFAEAI